MLSKTPVDRSIIVSATDVKLLNATTWMPYPFQICNHDEDDTRLILHAANALKECDVDVGKSVDTGVLIIAIHHCKEILSGTHSDKDIVMLVGVDIKQRYISVSQMVAGMPSDLMF